MSGPADIAPATDAGPAATGPGPGPGARLRAARELRGLALGTIAESLHVAPRLVAAMEANEFSAFDAPVYAKGFLRKYAAVLGIPADEVLAAYEAMAAGPSHPTLIPTMSVAPPPPALAALATLPRVPALAVGAALLVAAGGYWWWSGHARPAAPPAAQARTALEREAPVDGALVPAAQPASALESGGSAAAPAVAGEPGARAPGAVPLPLAAPLPAASTRPHTAAGAGHDVGLVIRGVAECWTEVYAQDGTRLLYDLVRPGELRNVPGPGPWRVVLGAADGARLTVGEHAVAVPAPRRGATTAIFVVGRDGVAH
ncbi:MAG TPA: helix-turn-helix domain-containing protein [Steroidobacteraceae bacterium]|nr:helix-turn-helix domain-containing protein [Steroidobacteraceae bacterium]